MGHGHVLDDMRQQKCHEFHQRGRVFDSFITTYHLRWLGTQMSTAGGTVAQFVRLSLDRTIRDSRRVL